MFRHYFHLIGLFALSAAVTTTASGQTNIDQGKTPAQMFASDCGACHKSTRGLANGRNSITLTGFLSEHYTSSRQQAASLAAYVLGAGGNDTNTPASARPQKPVAEHARPTAEEPKTGARTTRREAKPEDGSPATVKLQRPEEETKPQPEPGAPEESGSALPSRRPAGHEPRSVTATRGEKEEPAAAPQAPVTAPQGSAATPQSPAPTVVAAPAADAPANQETGPTANPASGAAAAPAANEETPAEAQPDDATPVPRDDIPD